MLGDGGLTGSQGEDISIAGTAPTDKDVDMEAGALRFGVGRAKFNWGALFRDMTRGASSAAGATFEDYSGKGRSVVVQNAHGEKRVLVVSKTAKEARERATAIEQEFHTLSIAEWCERYNVPSSFVSG